MSIKVAGLQAELIGELKKGETNMKSLKDAVAVAADAMHVILGASGNTGSIIASSLLAEGRKVRVMGRRGALAALCG